jgi:hypothetical protein
MRYAALLLAFLLVGSVHAQQAGTSGVLGAQQQYHGTFSSAQLLALSATPISLIPAPGIGSAIIIDEVIYEYTHVTTDYDTASQGGIFYGVPSSFVPAGNVDKNIATAVVNSGASMIVVSPAIWGNGPTNAPVPTARSNMENKDVEFGAPNGSIYVPYTGGDGTMTITIVYRILPL